MKSIIKIFSTARKGLKLVRKTSKIFKSVEIIGNYFEKAIDELETVWGVKQPETTETAES